MSCVPGNGQLYSTISVATCSVQFCFQNQFSSSAFQFLFVQYRKHEGLLISRIAYMRFWELPVAKGKQQISDLLS